MLDCFYSTLEMDEHAKDIQLPAEAAHIADAHAQLLLEEVGQGVGGLSEGEDALHAAPVPLLGELRQANCEQRLLVAAQVMVRHPDACSPKHNSIKSGGVPCIDVPRGLGMRSTSK